MIKKKWKQIFLITLVVLAAFYLFDSWANSKTLKFTYSEFLQAVEEGRIKSVIIKGNRISGPIEISGQMKIFLVTAPASEPRYTDNLLEKGIKVEFGEPIVLSLVRFILAAISCLIIFLGFIFLNLYVLKRMKEKTGRTNNNRRGPFKWIY